MTTEDVVLHFIDEEIGLDCADVWVDSREIRIKSKPDCGGDEGAWREAAHRLLDILEYRYNERYSYYNHSPFGFTLIRD